MERGTIRSIAGFSTGTIADDQGRVLNFSGGSVVGRDKTSLKTGDRVWFERLGSMGDSNAINIRKC